MYLLKSKEWGHYVHAEWNATVYCKCTLNQQCSMLAAVLKKLMDTGGLILLSKGGHMFSFKS